MHLRLSTRVQLCWFCPFTPNVMLVPTLLHRGLRTCSICSYYSCMCHVGGACWQKVDNCSLKIPHNHSSIKQQVTREDAMPNEFFNQPSLIFIVRKCTLESKITFGLNKCHACQGPLLNNNCNILRILRWSLANFFSKWFAKPKKQGTNPSERQHWPHPKSIKYSKSSNNLSFKVPKDFFYPFCKSHLLLLWLKVNGHSYKWEYANIEGYNLYKSNLKFS